MKFHASQNPVYWVPTFPENVYTLEGKQAFGNWSGGLLGVMTEQMKDLTKLHEQWYLRSWAEQRRKEGKG